MATSEVVAADWLNALLIEVVVAGTMKSNTGYFTYTAAKVDRV
jgi:hypothetical protein